MCLFAVPVSVVPRRSWRTHLKAGAQIRCVLTLVEWLQVHVLEDGSVQIYSRNLENTTSKYPDIAGRMAAALKPGVKSIVLDCEVQAWDPERKIFLPFQVLTTRKRKDVSVADVTVQARPSAALEALELVCLVACACSTAAVLRCAALRKSAVPARHVYVFAVVACPCFTTLFRTSSVGSVPRRRVQVVLYGFDCLYLNGKVMMREPLHVRRQAMYDSIAPQEGKIQFATAKTSRDVDELARFLDEAVEACTEGLIVKTLADTYEPSKRSLNWLKLKKDYLEGVGDTFDVAVIGALHGKGKRTGAPPGPWLARAPGSATFRLPRCRMEGACAAPHRTITSGTLSICKRQFLESIP
jgi:ATP dependent DNA ligase domain